MKKAIISIILMVSLSAFAGMQQVGSDLWDILKQVSPGTNDTYTLSIGAGENTSSHTLVEAGMLSIVNTNDTGVSIVGGRVDNRWVYGGGAFSLGRTDTWGFIGTVRESVGDGVIYDYTTRDPSNYVFVRIAKDFQLNKYSTFGFGGLCANRSNAQGVDLIGGIHFTFVPKNW